MQPVLRSPPAFEMDTGGDLFWRVLVSAVALVTAAVLLAWLCSHLAADLDAASAAQLRWHTTLLGLLLLPLACWVAWRGLAPVALTLRWDGQAWFLLGPQLAEPLAVHVQVVADLGDWLMLRLRPTGAGWPLSRVLAGWLRSCYLRLSRGDAAGHWPLLRATLFSAPAAPR